MIHFHMLVIATLLEMVSLHYWFLYSTFLLAGIAVFLTGFFPVKISNPSFAAVNETCLHLDAHCCHDEADKLASRSCFLQASYGRMIFILIDALRADFVLPDVKDFQSGNLARMKFVSSLILRNETISFTALAHPPTVTMPRVKVS
jgi:hypothetical protein